MPFCVVGVVVKGAFFRVSAFLCMRTFICGVWALLDSPLDHDSLHVHAERNVCKLCLTLFTPVPDIDAKEGGLPEAADKVRSHCEAEHMRLVALGAEERATAFRLFELTVSLNTADELISHPIQSVDTASVSRSHA